MIRYECPGKADDFEVVIGYFHLGSKGLSSVKTEFNMIAGTVDSTGSLML